jgi:hypothetical protein
LLCTLMVGVWLTSPMVPRAHLPSPQLQMRVKLAWLIKARKRRLKGASLGSIHPRLGARQIGSHMASGCRAPSRVASDPGLCCLPWIATLCSLLAASCPQVWPIHIGGSLPGHVRSGDVWFPSISARLSAHFPHTSLLLGGSKLAVCRIPMGNHRQRVAASPLRSSARSCAQCALHMHTQRGARPL